MPGGSCAGSSSSSAAELGSSVSYQIFRFYRQLHVEQSGLEPVGQAEEALLQDADGAGSGLVRLKRPTQDCYKGGDEYYGN